MGIFGNNNSSNIIQNANTSQLVPGRVISIDQTSTLSNGEITIEPMKISGNQPGSLGIKATPLFPNIKNYPLINETVYLLSFPSGDFGNNPGNIKYYYISPVKTWANNIHVNPTPAQQESIKGKNQSKSLEEVELGSPNMSTEQDTSNFKPGTYFDEKSNIYPLYPFEGDVILEGRFGNSLRFGSTDIQYGSPTSKNIINKQFSESYTYTSGETDLSLGFNSKLVAINNKVEAFFQNYDDDKVSIFIESIESQVPNPNNIARGELAKIRAQKAKDLVLSLSNFKYNISVNSRIGDTPYISGRDKPNDSKYLKDQVTNIKIVVQGTEVVPVPSQPQPLNNWSISGSNGDPITILRNGQNVTLTGSAQSLTVEDINKDLSSIYLTSKQQLPIEVSSQNDYLSYGEEKPIFPNQYLGAQVVLNSGRLLFNSTQDNIMLSSQKSINLNSLEGINMDTPGPIILESGQVLLGSREAEESVLLGDSTVDLLQNLISDLSSLLETMSNQIGNNGILLEPTATVAGIISDNLDVYQTQLDGLKSNIVKVE